MSIKKFMLGAAAAMTPAFLLAQEAADPGIGTEIGQLQEGIVGVFDDLKPAVVAIVLAGVAIWAIPFAWRKLRGAPGR